MTRRSHSRRRPRAVCFEEFERRCVLSVTFVDSGQALGDSASNAVALGDVDGDGDLDAVVANLDSHNRVWINDGHGIFTDSGLEIGQPTSSSSSAAAAVAIGDFDNDKDLDVFVSGNSNVWINDGLGRITDTGQLLEDSHFGSLALGDLDGDGDLDAFFANRSFFGQPEEGANKVWLNDGFGHFSDSGQSLGESDSVAVSVGDIDGDGDLDAVVANAPKGFGFFEPLAAENRVWLNDGSGGFSDSGQLLGNSRSPAIALGDLDGDGDLDIFVGNHQHGNEVWLNDGLGSFSDSGQSLGFLQTHGVALGDLDGDGDLDAFAANKDQPNKIWVNSGNAVFIESGQNLGDEKSNAVALGDLDGDGDLDAFVANVGPNKVWLNESPAVAFAAGDANGDFRFDQRDVVQVLQSAKYLTGESAIFEEGDWNADGVFDQQDILAALQTDNYLQGPYAANDQVLRTLRGFPLP